MKEKKKKMYKKNRAQAVVEFAIALPILLLVLYGLIETGRLLFIFSSITNATREAARYGTTSGDGPSGVPRYQDCAGIKAAAQSGDFLNAFDDSDIAITYDNPNGSVNFDGLCNALGGDPDVTPVTGDRIVITITGDFNALIPEIVPFLSRTVAGGNPITAISRRTLLLNINVGPPKLTPTITITDTPDPSQVGGNISVMVTVSGAGATPTGTITVVASTDATTFNCDAVTLVSGSASCVITFSSVGVKHITATYSGDGEYNGGSSTEPHQSDPAPTTTTITGDAPDVSLENQDVVVTVNVAGGVNTPTGDVTVTSSDGATCNVVITLSSGTGNCTITFTTLGAKTLTATYGGDAEHAASSDTETHNVVTPDSTITTITSDGPDPSETGQSVTVTVTVAAATTPAGTVDVTTSEGGNCTITLSGGNGNCSVSFSTTGNKTITATYNGDGTHTGSNDTEDHTVNLPATITTITSDSPDSSTVGATNLVTVSVSVTGGSTTPSGTVTITGADADCSITLSGGIGSCTVTFSSSGVKTLTATYSGDGSHAPSSDTESHIVIEIPCVTLGALTIDSGNKKILIPITNNIGATIQLTGLTLVWPSSFTANGSLKEIKIGGTQIMDSEDTGSPVNIPSEKNWKSGTDTDRNITNGQSKTLEFLFDQGAIATGYNLTLTFNNGCSVSLSVASVPVNTLAVAIPDMPVAAFNKE